MAVQACRAIQSSSAQTTLQAQIRRRRRVVCERSEALFVTQKWVADQADRFTKFSGPSPAIESCCQIGKSQIRHFVKAISAYNDIEVWTGKETADITYTGNSDQDLATRFLTEITGDAYEDWCPSWLDDVEGE